MHANSAPEILYNNLIVGDDDTVYLAWSNLDNAGRAQIFVLAISADGQTWSAIQQVSNAKGNASRPALALRNHRLHVAWPQHDHITGPSAAPVVGSPALPFDLKSLDGKSVGLASFRDKPLVMNFFASWCDPCRDEMPLINELAAKGVKDGYSVLGIAVEDTRAAVAQYAREAKLSFLIALDLNSTVKRSYRIFGPPATFFIDGHGIIRDIVLGPITRERAREGLRKTGIASGLADLSR